MEKRPSFGGFIPSHPNRKGMNGISGQHTVGNGRMRIPFRKRNLLALATLGWLIIFAEGSSAGSATWLNLPESGTWNSATNWSPATVPNGANDIATFAASGQ